ncbi:MULTISPECIES: LysR family transcriptional regulator [unclassified Brevundimonas]|uniref:LysR family transcriptional regulator n=1 Tax=unclassified Brevundimonas TaxID=2622653 RepID=UPI000CFE1ACA|nr:MULTISPECIES: LysR family transcriptional regulator [unclassified Brevundimonas]PRA29115.1 LysR family transcriptional regulator [Brevundimonas sp. MYb27]PQZ84837.1 LysR family transcriptional regulator [Brevundimonas sp. MYb31]PRB14571.1 LysR family transcriptional regulator [Brevundimonas sp. MYb52]PRB36656.1 LysR family transcriptional regulator [Brevundimonas sp. MYb46]PRB55645.1 LysR family transcriptional regulator [Brevundimonas sp. MYb33]
MSKLPDLEAMAIFAKVAETQSFSGATDALALSKATVSKAVSRLELRLGTTLLHRTSRRFSLTDSGRSLATRASQMVAEAEAAEGEALDQAVTPRGLVRLAAPMSFGMAYVAPALPEFLATHPDVSVDLHLSDATVALVGEGFDCAIRIASLPDSSLTARRLRPVRRHLVASPDCLAQRGRPSHPDDLARHACLGYAYLPSGETWRLVHESGQEVVVRPRGPLRANNADALTAALCAGLGIAVQPDFIYWRDVAEGRLETVMTNWALPLISVHLVAPGSGRRPARVTALMDYLTKRFSAPLWADQI